MMLSVKKLGVPLVMAAATLAGCGNQGGNDNATPPAPASTAAPAPAMPPAASPAPAATTPAPAQSSPAPATTTH